MFPFYVPLGLLTTCGGAPPGLAAAADDTEFAQPFKRAGSNLSTGQFAAVR